MRFRSSREVNFSFTSVMKSLKNLFPTRTSFFYTHPSSMVSYRVGDYQRLVPVEFSDDSSKTALVEVHDTQVKLLKARVKYEHVD